MSEGSPNFVGMVDFALLHPTLTDTELQQGCERAALLKVATVCIKPYAVKQAVQCLTGTGVGVGTVIGFPHGSHATDIKAAEARLACQDGATELDMVINVGKALSRDWAYVEQDIAAVQRVAKEHGAVLKVIFENDYISDAAVKITLCKVCTQLGVDYVKTSTGFGFVRQADGGVRALGATLSDLELMRKHCGPAVRVKAAGGVRDFATAQRMYELGVTRFGTSSPEALQPDARDKNTGY
ncbi:MAG: deoxyribose-phosphate aldolase [Fimbriimonadaceae bacterium]|nr:deoxyribose-phosphate aldolase [Fimbriimonadaceae bacterium]QYK54686.1 MAG: deoxyribose-phosphate aldolase [Fimbriimonadaceae bacterium]